VNVGKGDFKMPDDGERERKVQKFLAKKYEPYVEFAKKLLFEKVNNVIISNRLTTEPCVVVADTYGHSSFMDKIQKAQMFTASNDDNPLSDIKKIMEINPHHKVNQIILERIQVINNSFRTLVQHRNRPNNSKNSLNSSMRPPPSTQVSQPETPMNS
jgi:heat shock protein beta